jgi:hypothetical protein
MSATTIGVVNNVTIETSKNDCLRAVFCQPAWFKHDDFKAKPIPDLRPKYLVLNKQLSYSETLDRLMKSLLKVVKHYKA